MSRTYTKENKNFKSDMNLANTVPSLWNNDKIPPLVSINSGKQKERQEQISIQSLNQSEVKSIYTIDKQDFDKQVLDIFTNTDRSFRQNKADKIKVEPVVISDQQEQTKYFETPINEHKINNYQSTNKQFTTSYKDEIESQYDNCSAVKIYKKIMEKSSNSHNKSAQNQKFEFDWMKTKSPTEMIASILTNRTRMNLYVHYLLNQIYKNQQAKLINQIHQENVRQYNPTLKETYTHILCILSKIDCNQTFNKPQTAREKIKNNQKTKNQKPQISLFQNGLQIDINPKLTSIKKQNAEKIRQLKNAITQRQHQLQDTKRMYQQIIMNYAMTIQNLNKNQEHEGVLRNPFQQSRVKLIIQEQEEEIEENRKKHHTFGMKQPSNRSSANQK